MKRSFLILLASSLLAGRAFGYSVSFDLQADQLKTTSPTTAFPTTGLCLLVASTTNTTFGTINAGASLSVGSFLDGNDDQILGAFNLTNNNVAGVLALTVSATTGGTFANLSSGDPIALYWFPTLTLTNTVVPSTATSFGTYQTGNVAPLNGSASWVMPGGTTNNYALYFKTTDAAALGAGSHTPAEATAAFLTTPAVVPEPSSMALGVLAVTALGGMVLCRRVRTA